MSSRRKFRCVLVGLTATEDPSITRGLEFGVRLAQEHDAVLTIHVMAPNFETPLLSSGGSASAWLEMARKRCNMLGERSAAEAVRFAVSADISPTVSRFQDIFESRTARLTQLARVHDVTVLDAAPADPISKTAIEDTLFDSGSPALVVPAGGLGSMTAAMIAWDGSARAARAVRDALPILVRADRVDIVTVVGEKDLSRMAPGADLAGYLAAHGVVSCELDTLVAVDGDAARRLIARVQELRPGLIVMGAFVHSRFQEAVLGGVTRTFLDQPLAPLLLSH